MKTCEKCEATFLYDPAHHRCPGEWEALCAEAGLAPMEQPATTWVEECMAKQGTSVPPTST